MGSFSVLLTSLSSFERRSARILFPSLPLVHSSSLRSSHSVQLSFPSVPLLLIFSMVLASSRGLVTFLCWIGVSFILLQPQTFCVTPACHLICPRCPLLRSSIRHFPTGRRGRHGGDLRKRRVSCWILVSQTAT